VMRSETRTPWRVYFFTTEMTRRMLAAISLSLARLPPSALCLSCGTDTPNAEPTPRVRAAPCPASSPACGQETRRNRTKSVSQSAFLWGAGSLVVSDLQDKVNARTKAEQSAGKGMRERSRGGIGRSRGERRKELREELLFALLFKGLCFSGTSWESSHLLLLWSGPACANPDVSHEAPHLARVGVPRALVLPRGCPGRGPQPQPQLVPEGWPRRPTGWHCPRCEQTSFRFRVLRVSESLRSKTGAALLPRRHAPCSS